MTSSQSILRNRNEHDEKVSYSELFFDLIYVFSVTQLSHYLLKNLTLEGILETLVLWFAVYIAWDYTSWFTNFFNPENIKIRTVLFILMLLGVIMASSIPESFSYRGFVFALSYVIMQIGRSLYIVWKLGKKHHLTPTFYRMLFWLSITSILWIKGSLSSKNERLILWAIAILSEYFAPMISFWVPGLGKAQKEDWNISGAHMAERCQLFVIVALGESILLTGATLSKLITWDFLSITSYLIVFIANICMWWLYFDKSSHAAHHIIQQARHPAKVAVGLHNTHIILIFGIIVSAVSAKLIMSQPLDQVTIPYLFPLIGGPLIYILGNTFYKKIIYGNFPLSHLIGISLFLLFIPFSFSLSLIETGEISLGILLLTATWESLSRRNLFFI